MGSGKSAEKKDIERIIRNRMKPLISRENVSTNYYNIVNWHAWCVMNIVRLYFYSACRRRGGVLKCPRFCFFSLFFFRCRKLTQRSWVIPLAPAA